MKKNQIIRYGTKEEGGYVVVNGDYTCCYMCNDITKSEETVKVWYLDDASNYRYVCKECSNNGDKNKAGKLRGEKDKLKYQNQN